MKRTWPKIKLGNVLSLDLHKVQIDPSETYPMVGVLSFGRGLFDKEPITNGNTSYKHFLRLKENHFVMSQLFGWEGALATSDSHFSGKYVSPQFPTFVCDDSRLKLQFLKWNSASKPFWDELATRTNGMGDRRRTLNPAALFECQIPLPPLDVQERIVTRIDTVQQKLQTADDLRISTETELRSLFLSLHNTSGTKCKLGDLIELHEDAVRIQPSEVYPQVGVRGFGGGLFSKNAVLGTETTYKVFNRLYEDAIVLSQVKGWEGAIAVCPKSLSGMYVSPEYRTFRCNPNLVSPIYMQEVIRSPWFWKYLQEATRGVGARRERVRPEKFLAIELHMPSFDRQKTIVAILNALEGVRKIRAEIQPSIDAVTPSILQKELGQLRAEGE